MRSVSIVAAMALLLIGATAAADARAGPALRDHDAQPADTSQQDSAERRLSECLQLHALTPEQVTAFLRGDRRLSAGNICDTSVANGLHNSQKTDAEKAADAIGDAQAKKKQDDWNNRKTPSPEAQLAQDAADKARDQLKSTSAAAEAAQKKLDDVAAANRAAAEAAATAKQQQAMDVAANQDALMASQQSQLDATKTYVDAKAKKKQDADQAQQDAALREQIASQRAAQQKQAEADVTARAQMQEQLEAAALKRKQDQADADADRLQAEQDQQLVDEQLRKQHEAERAEKKKAREQREAEREALQTKLDNEEHARVQQEHDAKAAAAKRDRDEAQIKQREEARAARVRDAETTEAKLKDAEAEFQRNQAEHEATMKKYDEMNAKLSAEEQARVDAEKKAMEDKAKADADAQKAEEDVPDEEKPKKDNEEECAPSPGGAPPNCEHGGRCFQVPGSAKQRCSCPKGYKGDKCQYKPCPPPAKEGNMVDGKCVRWESEYVCPGCNKIWDRRSTCHEIDIKTSAKKSAGKNDCGTIKEPKNELYNRMCKFCLDSSSVDSVPGTSGATESEGSSQPVNGDRFNSESRNSSSESLRHRQLASNAALVASRARYEFAPSFPGRGGPSLPQQAFVYSVYEHEVIRGDGDSVEIGLNREQCIMSCFKRIGGADLARRVMGFDFCSWLIWVPPWTHGTTVKSSECRRYNSGTFPEEPPHVDGVPNPRVLRGNAPTGMLAFVTYPRVYDMLRPVVRPMRPPRTFQVRGSQDTFVAVFSTAGPAILGSGTYVTKDRQPPLPNCLATVETRHEAGRLYEWRMHQSGIQNADVLAPYPLALTPGLPVTIRSTVPGGEIWTYNFDSLLRVTAVKPTQREITNANLGGRDSDSPQAFQQKFRDIMRVGYFDRTTLSIQAGHLVAASQKPPNWFFNYVPQNQTSNAGGCWWFAEAAARSLLGIHCELTYGVRLEYADPPLVASEAECYDAFRPSKMSLDLQIVRGDGVCKGMADEWSNKPLVEYDATSRALRTTRLMAYTLHQATLELDWIRVQHEKDLVGLLHVATAQPSVNQCDADAGAIFDFSSLTLRTDFQSAKLFVDNNCLTEASNSPLLSKGAANCVSWRTAHDVNGTPQDLITIVTNSDGEGSCITMTNMVVGFLRIDVAMLTPTTSAACLKFIYMYDPFAALVAPAQEIPPVSGTISVATPAAARSLRPISALVTGLIGLTDASGVMTACLYWNAGVDAYQLGVRPNVLNPTVAWHAGCERVEVTQTR